MLEYNRRSIRTWSLLGPSGAFGAAALELAETVPNIALITADLCYFSGLERVRSAYPELLYNVGIAEQNMIGIAAGMAKEGLVPFATTYASFAASRCADQVRVNMSYMKLPIKLVGLTAGNAAGVLGATHMSVEDVAYMRALPNITVLSPADCTEIVKAVMAAAKTPDPTYIRLTGPTNTPIVYREDYDYQIGKAIELVSGRDVCIIATGSMVYRSLQAALQLESTGISCSVINMHTIKPLDEDAVLLACASHRLVLVAEEHSVYGGLYGAIAELCVRAATGVPIVPICIEDAFVPAGSYDYQMELCGLTSQRICEVAKRGLEGGRGGVY